MGMLCGSKPKFIEKNQKKKKDKIKGLPWNNKTKLDQLQIQIGKVERRGNFSSL